MITYSSVQYMFTLKKNQRHIMKERIKNLTDLFSFEDDRPASCLAKILIFSTDFKSPVFISVILCEVFQFLIHFCMWCVRFIFFCLLSSWIFEFLLLLIFYFFAHFFFHSFFLSILLCVVVFFVQNHTNKIDFTLLLCLLGFTSMRFFKFFFF